MSKGNGPFSTADLFLIAAALRHERASRWRIAQKRGHRAKGLAQCRRLELLFVELAKRSRSPD